LLELYFPCGKNRDKKIVIQNPAKSCKTAHSAGTAGHRNVKKNLKCLQPSLVGFHLLTKFDGFKPHGMQRIFTLLLVLLAFGAARAQQLPAAAATPDVLTLKETEHDFGKIPQGKPVYYNFEVVNSGTTPLVLEDVHASCGCTTPEWSRDPIAPGATAVIRVGYNAAAEGFFEKPITINVAGQMKQMKIKGTVWRAPEGPAPANSSVQFLKKQTL
jgi:hypothetical protein